MAAFNENKLASTAKQGEQGYPAAKRLMMMRENLQKQFKIKGSNWRTSRGGDLKGSSMQGSQRTLNIFFIEKLHYWMTVLPLLCQSNRRPAKGSQRHKVVSAFAVWVLL